MAKNNFSLSANIESGFPEGTQYIVTPNAQKVVESIVNGFQTGIHSYTIIGTYGTGKSSFLIALKEDLLNSNKSKYLLQSPQVLHSSEKFETLDIVGDYADLALLLSRKLNVEGSSNSVIDELRKYYDRVKAKGKFLVIFIDEFGKVLEHAAKNDPERELYFMQKLAEFVNVPTRKVLLLTTLHQNFSSYAKGLTQAQRNEWTKVKGRFQEIVFVEPVEQLLYLASKQITDNSDKSVCPEEFNDIYKLALTTKFVASDFSYETAKNLFPLDPFAAYGITQAIQRYGQNERSLFTFLNARGNNSFTEFIPQKNLVYNLQKVYDYVFYNFYSYLKDANADSMNWSAMQIAIERVEGLIWESEQHLVDAIKIVKAIGLLNLLGTSSFSMSKAQFSEYAEKAMAVANADTLIKILEQYKIIRYAEYKHRLILFEGTDINIEEEISKAGMVVSRPVVYIDELQKFFTKKVAPVKSYYYRTGTPRFFEYQILEEAVDMHPSGDIDGYIQLIFSTKYHYKTDLLKISSGYENPIIIAYFNNADEIVDHLYTIQKYDYILKKVLLDQSDKVAVNEINNLKDYEKVLLNKAINDSLYTFNKNVTWIYKGEIKEIKSQRDFNELLSYVCEVTYKSTPVLNNELFNKNKISSSISAAKVKYLTALVNNSNEIDLGFEQEKFPPEKTIYYSLLKNTGLHVNGSFSDSPSNDDILSLWDACEDFLKSTTNKPRKISELIKKLSKSPFKLKGGFLDFWIPTYLYIKKQDYSLYGNNGAYIPDINMEFFELLQKHPSDFSIKAFDISGVKMEFFNHYRKFVNLEDVGGIKSSDFIDTIKPFFYFYNRRLNEYAKHTDKFEHKETKKFRDILAHAKDPEKTFLEDLPEALGYDREAKDSERFAKEYGYVINRAVKELRSCYNKLIDRIEERVVECLRLDSYDYDDYIIDIRKRFEGVKTYLLTDRQKEFHSHVMAEFDNRTEWYQSICYTALDQPLERLRDNQEEKLIEELIELFRECEKYADISKVDASDKDEIYSFDLASSLGDNIKPQTYRLLDKDKKRAADLETKINEILTGNDNFDIVTLLKILKKKIK